MPFSTWWSGRGVSFSIGLGYTVYACAVAYTYNYKYIALVFWCVCVYLLVILHIVVGACRRHGQKYSEHGFFSGKLTTSVQVRKDPQRTNNTRAGISNNVNIMWVILQRPYNLIV